MSNSGDSFILSLFFLIIPTITILVGVFIYSRIVIFRYSKVVKRLYKMNFNSLETERKRISNDLHDQLGYKILIINKSIENLISNPLLADNEEIIRIQSNIRLFQLDIRKILESIHPQWKVVWEHREPCIRSQHRKHKDSRNNSYNSISERWAPSSIL